MKPLAMFIAICVAGCGGRSASPAEVTRSTPKASLIEADSGASAPTHACSHEVKDPFPCAEECDRGIAFACTVIAERVERGDGIPRDAARAVALHERACELRTAASCVHAARMHAAGVGVPRNRPKQIELLVAACNLGDATACSVPAKALESGAGVGRDEQQAKELWQRACAGGVAQACADEHEP